MAKAGKSFADKTKSKKDSAHNKMVRVIRSVRDEKEGPVRFLDRMVSFPDDGNLDQNLADFVKK